MSEPQQQVLNLQTLANNFLGGLQRHYDMLSFTLASRESVSEEAYKRHTNATQIIPVPQAHLNFEQLQAYSRDLLVRQALGDALNLSVAFLNNIHLFLALVKAQSEGQGEAAQKKAQEWQQAFVQAPLDEKFNKLENDYEILCEAEDTIISLGMALQVLMQRNGQVSEAELDSEGELGFDLKVFEPNEGGVAAVGVDGVPAGPLGKLGEERLAFKEGDVLIFKEVQLQQIIVTVGVFMDRLLRDVSAYAQRLHGESQQ